MLKTLSGIKGAVRESLGVLRLSLSSDYFNPGGFRDVVEPSIIVIGAQRAGTTFLHACLSAHPGLLPSKRKEVHFFDVNYHRGVRFYHTNFVTRRGRPNGDDALRSFETTPYYLYHPLVPARMYKMIPDAKIIAIFREPISRALSHHQNEVRRGEEPLSFEEAIEREEERLAGEEKRIIADPSYYSYAHQHYSYIDRGRYDVQVERWLEVYPREQFHFMKAETLFSNTPQALSEVSRFLNIPDFPPIPQEPLNVSKKKSPLPDELRVRLKALFAPHNARLGAMTGLTYDWDKA